MCLSRFRWSDGPVGRLRRASARAVLRTSGDPVLPSRRPGRAARSGRSTASRPSVGRPGCTAAGTDFVLPLGARPDDHGEMNSRADYCPISIGVDVLGDRWTPLVIRELMVGAHGFNEIHRGIPRISRSLLAGRLRQLERLGLVVRHAGAAGKPGRYDLTPAGEALTPIVWAMGQWAAEWKFGEPTEQDCDGLSVIWRLHQHAIPDEAARRAHHRPSGPDRHQRGRGLARARLDGGHCLPGRPGPRR